RRSRENIPIEETCFHPAPTLAAGLSSSIHAFEPAVDLALGLVLRHAVALLKPAAELHALTLDDVKIIVGEHAPLLLNLAPELFPLTSLNCPPTQSKSIIPLLFPPSPPLECPAGEPSAPVKVPMRDAGSNAVPLL